MTGILNVLSVAGSDPSGGAGIQADLKTFAALGAYGMAAVTALTVQNTHGVLDVHLVPPEFVARQLEAVFVDVRVDAVKVGMLASAATVEVVADALAHHEARAVVLDPVLMSSSGRSLLDPPGVAVLRARLLPQAFVITPNLAEAGALLDAPAPVSVHEMRAAARALHALGPQLVYVKGGHLDQHACVDVVFDGEEYFELTDRRIDTRNTHGTGCALASAIAALLPSAATPLDAMRRAKAFVTGAIAASNDLTVGMGTGPVHHLHSLWSAGAMR